MTETAERFVYFPKIALFCFFVLNALTLPAAPLVCCPQVMVIMEEGSETRVEAGVPHSESTVSQAVAAQRTGSSGGAVV